ncbi:MAG: hypothetical protein GY950_14595 [bacterium]|nr:hypothetical protein [bacterium]
MTRIEIRLDSLSLPGWIGYHLVGGQMKALPIGSTLDRERGIFYWQPGPGFLGEYIFIFIKKHPSGQLECKRVLVTIIPKSAP